MKAGRVYLSDKCNLLDMHMQGSFLHDILCHQVEEQTRLRLTKMASIYDRLVVINCL